ncbi:PepSY domain-containing protein [Gulosibacter sp. ACHW.36C]|uniref:PepSY domain-containing protein n=1 Tax=Gulosibacter sediminis TaxID=1729695 RepID=A0ABY4MY22_9MICO|nr:PepSY domain-containing protein [Gulosibacter sediminis]UQN14669.1 PepSY domain-containing protein [Gulosibacter sediminis]
MSKHTTRTVFALFAAPILLGTLAACSSADSTSTDPAADSAAPAETGTAVETTAPAETAAPQPDAADGGSGTVDIDYTTAITTAQDAVGPGAIAVALDLDDNDSERFEIEVAYEGAEYEVEVAAEGTARVDEQDEEDDDDHARLSELAVRMEQAIALAQTHQDGAIDSVELDTDDGALEWEIDYDDDDQSADLIIDATTGDIREDD